MDRISIILFLVVIVIVVCQSQQSSRNLLLYKINEDKSVYIIDKMRQVSLEQLDEDKSSMFIDGDSSASENEQDYTLLYSNDDYMLIGSLDILYNVSLRDLNDRNVVNRKTNFSIDLPMVPSYKECGVKRSPTGYYNPYKCGNYIKVAVPLLDNSILLTCSTNKLSPICLSRFISRADRQQQLQQKVLLDVPQHVLLTNSEYSRRHNVPPFVYGNSIYYFYVSDKTSDGIFKQNFVEQTDDRAVKFTELVNVQSPAVLNPNFRSSYGFKDKVYFFFSELDTSENSDVLFKTPTSFVGEICADDDGRRSYNYGVARFLTFKKAVINCYLPDFTDKIHIKYNEIQQVTKPIGSSSSSNSSDIFYAIFTLRRANSIDSALCQYRMTSVESSMRGLFKFNPDKKPVQPYGSCSDYKSLTSEEIDAYYRGINTNNKYQMEQTINSRAMFALNSAKFTSLAVDSSLSSSSHVIYIGLDNGRLLKIINTPSSSGHFQPVIVGEYEMFANRVPISDVIVAANVGQVVAVSARGIRSLSVDAICSTFTSCAECMDAQDPYCSWSSSQAKCVYFKHNYDINVDEKCQEEKSMSGISEQEENEEREKSETETKDQTTIESNLLYTINDYSKQPAIPKQLVSHQSASSSYGRRSSSSSSAGITIILILLVSLVVSLLSVFLTCVFIKRNYDVRNKTNRLLIESGGSDLVSNSCNHTHSSSASSSSSFKPHLNYFNPDRLVKFLNRYYFINSSDSNHETATSTVPSSTKKQSTDHQHRQKILNCYEIATSATVKKDNLKPVTVLTTCSNSSSSSSRPNSSTESPYTNNTTASSSVESNSNSPNNSSSVETTTKYLSTTAKYVGINTDTSLSSSDEMIHHHRNDKKSSSGITTKAATVSLLINKIDR